MEWCLQNKPMKYTGVAMFGTLDLTCSYLVRFMPEQKNAEPVYPMGMKLLVQMQEHCF